MTNKREEIQAQYLAALQLMENHEHEKAAREFEKLLTLQESFKKSVASPAGFDRTTDEHILLTMTTIAWCYRQIPDAAKTRDSYLKAIQFADTFATIPEKIQIYGELASLYAQSLDYARYMECCDNILKLSNESRAAAQKQSLADQVSRGESCLTLRKTIFFDRFHFWQSFNEYDRILKYLDDREFKDLNTELEKCSPEAMLARYPELENSTSDNLLSLLGFIYETGISNSNAHFMIPTLRGICHREKGEPDRAMKDFDEASKSLDSINYDAQNKMLALMEKAINQEKDTAGREEQAHYAKLLAIFRNMDIGETAALHRINNKCQRGQVLDAMGDHDRAQKLFQEALKESERIPYDRISLAPRILRLWSKSLYRANKLDQALEVALKINKLNPPWLNNIEVNEKNFIDLGLIYEKKNNLAQAEHYYREATGITGKLRTSLYNVEGMNEFFTARMASFEGMVRILLDKGASTEALEFAEKSKARSLTEHFGAIAAAMGMSEQEQQELNNLNLKKNQLENRMQDIMVSEKPKTPEEQKRRDQLLHQLDMELRDTMSAIMGRIKDSNKSNIVNGSVAKIQDAQGLLDDDTAVIYYFYDSQSSEGLRKTRAWVITAHAIEAVSLSISPENLEKEIMHLRRMIRDKDPGWTTPGRSLYQALIEPLERLIKGKRHVVISPFRSLHYLPFSALIDSSGSYLAQTVTTSMIPSLTALKACREAKSGQGKGIMAYSLGNLEVSGFSPLPGTDLEVAEIKKTFPDTTIFSGKDFSKARIEEQAKGKEYIHFATHGRMDANAPVVSGIVTGDNMLTIPEIMNLKIPSSTVVLSACETGLGKLYPGDDQAGITRAFMFAGSPAIVSSLWSVSDESTARLMSFFYRNLAKKMDRAEALRQAELSLMKEYPEPYYWAPFILTGTW